MEETTNKDGSTLDGAGAVLANPEHGLFYDIRLDTGAKYIAYSSRSLNLKNNDWCVIRKERALDYGQIVHIYEELPCENIVISELPTIERKATVLDQSKAHENEMRAKSAFRTAQKYVDDLKVPMRLLNAHYSYDGKLITFQFTADGRVDFRELVKQVSQALNTRIELRQIGVRDETALLGGLGVCGLQLCCNRFLRDFTSINVRMAKEQDLSLNPTNISGMCGRLKCCLKYEHEGYLDLDRGMPRRGALCDCPEGRGKIIDRNLLTQHVLVALEDSGKTFSCDKDEIRVIYPDKYRVSAKQKKTPDSFPAEADEHEDLFDGLDEEEARLLKQIEED